MFLFIRPALVCLVLWVAGVVHAASGLIEVPALTGRVLDLSATLTNDELGRLDRRLREFEEQKGSQVAVLIVPTTQPEAIEQYAIRVADQWKIGRKKIDDGAILVVAKNDRALRIEVGYGLEGVLNDATSKRIIEELVVPRFKDGDFYGGIDAGVTAMMRVIEGEPLPPPKREKREAEGAEQLLPAVFVAALVLGGALRTLLGRLPAALLTGGILGVAAWFVAGIAAAALTAAAIGFFLTLVGGRMGMLGWYGGHGHHGSGRSGWSGGGGRFGGGGASGRW